MTDLFDDIDAEEKSDDASDIKNEAAKTSPACGLYIILSDTDDHEKQCFQLAQALFAANRFSTYSINRHVVEFRPSQKFYALSEEKQQEITKAYCDTTQQNGFIFLVHENSHVARASGADGVICESLKTCSSARKILDETAIIGMRCSTQAQAQSALSLELDFISVYFEKEPLLAILNWWTTSTDAPIAVEGQFSQEDCAPFIIGGATFIDASEQIWNHASKNPMQGVVNMLDAIERHGNKQSQLN